VEVDVSNGLPMMAVVGLPDAAVNEPGAGAFGDQEFRFPLPIR
jgi:predicted ATPase with chaperone activity